MGFFDDKLNSFESTFDLNRDGRLDMGERAFMFNVLEEEERMIENENKPSWDDDDLDLNLDDDDDFDLDDDDDYGYDDDEF